MFKKKILVIGDPEQHDQGVGEGEGKGGGEGMEEEWEGGRKWNEWDLGERKRSEGMKG